MCASKCSGFSIMGNGGDGPVVAVSAKVFDMHIGYFLFLASLCIWSLIKKAGSTLVLFK